MFCRNSPARIRTWVSTSKGWNDWPLQSVSDAETTLSTGLIISGHSKRKELSFLNLMFNRIIEFLQFLIMFWIIESNFRKNLLTSYLNLPLSLYNKTLYFHIHFECFHPQELCPQIRLNPQKIQVLLLVLYNLYPLNNHTKQI